jgi:hypothetical protein
VEEEEVADEADWAVGNNWESFDDDEDAANAEVVEERLLRVWSMFQSDCITDGLSNLSRIEIVLTMSSKECGSTLMMAMTASSS